jgi:hypothetical protein
MLGRVGPTRTGAVSRGEIGLSVLETHGVVVWTGP